MTDFAESIRGWGSDDGDATDEYERLLAAYKIIFRELNRARENCHLQIEETRTWKFNCDEARAQCVKLERERAYALLWFDGTNWLKFDRDNLAGVDPATLAILPLNYGPGTLLYERDDARSVARYYRKCIYDMIELGWVKQKSKALALLDKELEETPWLGEKEQ